jgi:hypothetical protein
MIDNVSPRDMSHVGPSRHLPRCSDLVTIGGTSGHCPDMANRSLVTHLCHSVVNVVALHLSEFLSHDLGISHRAVRLRPRSRGRARRAAVT